MQINQLVKTLLQKDTLDQCSLNELEQYADRNPYFGAAQLLLTKKLQDERSDRYDEQLQKTLLFFHNPLWVEQMLNDTGHATVMPAEKKEVVVPAAEPWEKNEDEIPESIPVSNGPDQTGQPAAEVQLSVIENPTETEKADHNNQVEETPVLLKEEAILPGAVPAEVNQDEEDPHHLPVPDETLSLAIPALQIENIDPATAELSFEPFHTVDYFASQGIKFKEEERPKDKFGLQLKSFTDWLRTMKKLPATAITATIEKKAEEKVEQLAENSIEGKDVVTETMAEVWEKQGNARKAIEVYNKLSLLYPSKSPYFAAKIEDLKKIT